MLQQFRFNQIKLQLTTNNLLDGAECELNCKPVNQKYFARLKEYVIDGTECNIPQHNQNKMENFDRAVCIEGVCKVCQYFFI